MGASQPLAQRPALDLGPLHSKIMMAQRRPRKRDPLQERMPSNPKYAHVRSTLDTGASMSKFVEKHKETFHPKKDEYFKRIKGGQLVELLEDEDVEEETVYGLMGAQESEVGPTVVHGEGDQDMDEALYLLLDLRDEAEYDACHINTAMPYPHTLLTHSTNYFTAEIYRYKNRPDRMIIIYDDDERIAAPAGKLFVEKGVENVYILSGGLRKFCDKHEEFVLGTPPEYVPSCPPTAKSGRSGSRAPPTGASKPPATARSGASAVSAASRVSAASARSYGAPSLVMR